MVELAKSGEMTFTLINDGQVTHALEIEGQGIEEESDEIDGGATTALTVDLEPGEYRVLLSRRRPSRAGDGRNDRRRRLGSRRAAPRPRPGDRDRQAPDRAGERDHRRTLGSRVGHTTLIEGEDVRTGVTVVVPPPEPLFAGAHRINGNGELTGLEWVRDSGQLTTPIGLTNTHSVGVVRDALVARRVEPPASTTGASLSWARPGTAS